VDAEPTISTVRPLRESCIRRAPPTRRALRDIYSCLDLRQQSFRRDPTTRRRRDDPNLPKGTEYNHPIVHESGSPTPASDTLVAELTRGLPVRLLQRIAAFDRAGSTNNLARGLHATEPGGRDVVLADLQTEGRGRFGRRWYGERSSSLHCSMVVSTGAAHMLPVAAALAAAEAVQHVGLSEVGIKWPNDLVFDGRKLGGVLIESINPRTFVVGVGINVGRLVFPDDIAPGATTVSNATGVEVPRMRVLSALIRRMDERVAELDDAGMRSNVLAAYRSRLAGVGRPVEFRHVDGSAAVQGTLEGVDDDGALLLRTNDALLRFHAGDLTTQTSGHVP